ncbi:peptidoglycan DD-metalloendopeptidase family protein [Mycoavidus sp. B2-EB]|uniref:peptidoglycan DD-metalloendopeptidase family protein n=1 Tax=Mycoavidus sp. B2-EB TaxID=2651972 RepID=UPI00162617D7|nr:peptidoglycan DD-metalloendopeptidase family protein [Mycoavidus sp. B2-EB]BBO59306.1 peptidase [Mycoavidus sp. B2-EB]
MTTLRRFDKSCCLAIFPRVLCGLSVLVFGACSTRLVHAPISDRFEASALASQLVSAPAPPGYYRVKPGDTVYRIALENGQHYQDIVAWNNLQSASQVAANQLLRVTPPGAEPAPDTPGVSTAPVIDSAVQVRSLESSPAADPSGPSTEPGAQTPAAAPVTALAWPVRGPVLGTFDELKNKGLDIGGVVGTPISAAADGRIVYAGNGLRGYGNLIIIKHDATFLTAYAHNRALFVKEGEAVTRGQKIAEMGNSDANRVMLHFEVRQRGKPVDPMKYLSTP